MADIRINMAGLSTFSEAATKAAYRGAIPAGPLLYALARAHNVALGLRELFNVLRENETQRLCYDNRDDGDNIAPPLSPNTIDNFTALGAAVCELVQEDIEHLAKWADTRAGEASRDAQAPAVSRRGRKPKDSSREAQ